MTLIIPPNRLILFDPFVPLDERRSSPSNTTRMQRAACIMASLLLLDGAHPLTTDRAEPRGLAGGLAGSLSNLGSLLDTGIAVLDELLTTLQAGQTEQNGLLALLGNSTSSSANGTANSVGAGTACPDMAVLFARGTLEPGQSRHSCTVLCKLTLRRQHKGAKAA